jgi:hypothetical protein
LDRAVWIEGGDAVAGAGATGQGAAFALGGSVSVNRIRNTSEAVISNAAGVTPTGATATSLQVRRRRRRDLTQPQDAQRTPTQGADEISQHARPREQAGAGLLQQRVVVGAAQVATDVGEGGFDRVVQRRQALAGRPRRAGHERPRPRQRQTTLPRPPMLCRQTARTRTLCCGRRDQRGLLPRLVPAFKTAFGKVRRRRRDLLTVRAGIGACARLRERRGLGKVLAGTSFRDIPPGPP